MAKAKKGFVVVREDDSEDNIAIPQSRTVRLSNRGRNIIQTARSPQKGAVPSNRFPSPVYEWNASHDYDTIDLLPGNEADEEVDVEELPVAAKVAAKRYPTSVSMVHGTRCTILTAYRMLCYVSGQGKANHILVFVRSTCWRC